MAGDRGARLRGALDLVDELFDLPEAEREAVLAGVEPELRAEAKKLLAGDARSSRLLGRAAVGVLRAAVRDLGAAHVVADRFEIEALAGAGGMGVVYRALDRATGDRVALKLLACADGDHPGRFVREGRTLAELEHPNIVRYVAHGLSPEGLYLAMEWLEGETLAARLATRGLSIAESVDVVRKAADALRSAHARGIVHRDLKPSNLFLVGGRVDQLKILDFGIARDTFRASGATESGAVMGTPGYMAPEQARGDRGVDGRADVFALGCVLYECLTGEPAFVGRHPVAVLAKILVEEPPRPSSVRDGIAPELDALVARMLNKLPQGRPPDAASLARELASIREAVATEGRAPLARRAPAITTGEQRLVSIVFAPAGLEAGPSAGRSRLAQELAAFGAQPAFLADGSVLVVLAGTSAATDIASRAARCALALRDRLLVPDLVVVTGRTVLEGRQPVGEVMERALRLAAPRDREREPGPARPNGGDVRLDDVTAALLDASFEVSTDTGGYVLHGERESTGAVRTLLGKPTPLVGREREMAALVGVFEECANEPTARAFLVTGPAGIGKSRLRHEFLRTLRARSLAARVWLARADPMSHGSPFGLLAEAVRRAAGVHAGEPPETVREKLAARVLRSVGAPEAQRVAEFLGELVGAPFSGEDSVMLRAARGDAVLMGDQIRRAWEDFVQAEARRQPIVIVLEDLHWGDLPTVRAIDGALRALGEAPVMVLALARPEVHDVFPGLWHERALTELRLSGLSRKASERLVREALGEGVERDEVARITQRADGNAFYLEELIRAVAEGKGGELPETVLAMMQGRLAALDPEQRRVLRAGSLFGDAFAVEGARALLGGEGSTERLALDLEELTRKELVTARPWGRFSGQRDYAFRHALVREAAYASLTAEDRALGHKLAGEWLEKAGEQDALVLAEHYERGAVRDKAAQYYGRAAEHALEGNDYAAAIRHADRAVGCGVGGSALGGLFMLQAVAHRWGGTIEGTERCALLAAEAFEQGEAGWFEAMGWSIWASSRLGSTERIATLLERLGSTLPAEGAAGASVIALCRAGCQMVSVGDFEAAARLQRLAEERAASCPPEPLYLAHLSRLRGFVAGIVLGDLGESVAHTAAAAAAFERAGEARSACQERINEGNGYVQLGCYREARAVLEQARAVAERMAIPPMRAFSAHNLGVVLARLGEVQEGRALEERAAHEFEALGDKSLASASASFLARILLESGDVDGAAAAAGRAIALGEKHPVACALASTVSALVHLARRDVAEGLSAARRANGLLDDIGSIEDGEVLTRLAYAEALRATGVEGEAREALCKAKELVLSRAGRIKDESLRASFLKVPENARALELDARAWSES